MPAPDPDDIDALIAGVVPLAAATGAGAQGRIAIGTAVLGGMMTGSRSPSTPARVLCRPCRSLSPQRCEAKPRRLVPPSDRLAACASETGRRLLKAPTVAFHSVAEVADVSLQHLADAGGRRLLVAIASAPGSGKSTLAEMVVDRINGEGRFSAALFPMDGFHYDDAVLEAMGRRQSKGAIDTFDAHGLRHTLERLKANEDDVVAVPVFDRSIEIARAGDRLIPQSTDIIVCEGNYLLSSQEPWNRLKAIFDFTVFVDVPIDDLRARLQKRWRDLGLAEADVIRKVEENDLPNGLSIISTSIKPHLRIENSGDGATGS